MVFGPGQIQSANSPAEGMMHMTLYWPHSEVTLDEWEGYAVVVPEKNQVWGACKPEQEGENIEATFQFAPRNIPPKDRKLFVKPAQAPKTKPADSDESDD